LVPLLIFSLAFAARVFAQWGVETQQRAVALTATLAGCVLFSGFPDKIFVPLTGWAAALVVTILTGSRMATLALVLAPALHVGYRSLKGNVIAIAGFVTIAIALFFTPAFQARFFYTGGGDMEDLLSENFDSAGRFDAWPVIWDESQKTPLLGAGVGVSRQFVPTIWPDIYHVHNDYLRVIFEQGWVGLTIFVSVFLWQLGVLWKMARTSSGVLRTAFVAAWLGFAMLLVTSATDNTIIYNLFYTDPLFAILGAAWGVYAQEQRVASAELVAQTETQPQSQNLELQPA
jgi:O-antigen ligase